MFRYLGLAQSIELPGELKVVRRFVQVEVRRRIGAFSGAIPDRGDARIRRHVAFGSCAQSVENCADAPARRVGVIHDQQSVVGVQVLQQVLGSVYTDERRTIAGLLMRGPDGDVVGVYAQGLQAFLDDDADGRTAAPEANDECRAEARFEYSCAQSESVEHLLFFSYEAFGHERAPRYTGWMTIPRRAAQAYP